MMWLGEAGTKVTLLLHMCSLRSMLFELRRNGGWSGASLSLASDGRAELSHHGTKGNP